MKKLILLMAASLLLSGCAVFKRNQEEKDVKASVVCPTCPLPNDSLVEAADSINEQLTKLAAVEEASVPFVGPDVLTDAVIPGLMGTGSIDWYGPVEPLLNRIAAAGNYKVRVLGTEPAIPVIVAVTANDVPLATILRDASFQAAKKARITAYPESKTIELRYFHA